MEYHCHLNGKAKEMFGNYDMEEMEINRRDTKQQGIPKSEKYLANGCVKYDNEKQKWICAICNKEGDKYSWRQLVNRYISNHSGEDEAKTRTELRSKGKEENL